PFFVACLLVTSVTSLASAQSAPRHGHAAPHHSNAAPRFVGSYDAAMQIPVAYDMTQNQSLGAELTQRQIAAPLTAALPRFSRCVAQETARGNEITSVNLHIAVSSAGTPMGATVDDGSAAFRTCVVSVVRSLHWQRFSGPRMGFAWGFSLE